MTTTEKIVRAYTESKTTQGMFATLCGIHQNQVSKMYDDGWNPTIVVVLKVARSLGWDVAWLIDDNMDWPPVPAGTTGRVLSPAEEEVLKIAKRLSRHDPDPSQLETAIDRLEQAPSASTVPESKTIDMTGRPPQSPPDTGKSGRKGRNRA